MGKDSYTKERNSTTCYLAFTCSIRTIRGYYTDGRNQWCQCDGSKTKHLVDGSRENPSQETELVRETGGVGLLHWAGRGLLRLSDTRHS